MIHTRLCLVSVPGPICDATCATIATVPHARLVILAPGALSATRLLHQTRADLVLLDVNIPRDEVLALLTWLTEHIPDICTIVARSTSAECDQARAFGADEAMRRDELSTRLGLYIAEMIHA